MGFVVFMVMGLYLLISLGVVAWAVSQERRMARAPSAGAGARRW